MVLSILWIEIDIATSIKWNISILSSRIMNIHPIFVKDQLQVARTKAGRRIRETKLGVPTVQPTIKLGEAQVLRN